MSRLKIFASSLCTAALLLSASFNSSAQQLPNSDFSKWKSSCGSTDAMGDMRQRPGVEPEDWYGSSVNQKVSGVEKSEILVFNDNGLKLQNKYVGVSLGFIKIGSVAPGYISLGTPWVYATATVSKCDGGTYGGMEFAYRPDVIQTKIKRDDSTGENSHIIVYCWSGTFKSKIGEKGNPSSERDDVDRAIMGTIENIESGTLIASADYSFTETNDIQILNIPLEYHSSEKPEKINVIISAGDYWTRDNMKENTTLYAYDVKLIYYSRLSGINYTADGKSVAVPEFDSQKYDYEIAVNNLPTAVSPKVLSPSGSSKATLTETSRTAKEVTYSVTVTNSNGSGEGFEDIDGQTSHTYTLKFKKVLQLDLTKIIIGDKEIEPETGNAFANDAIISTEMPFTTQISIETLGTDSPVFAPIVRGGNNDNPTAQLTVSHPDDPETQRNYTLSFLPYRAAIEEIVLANGSHVHVSGDYVTIGEQYSTNLPQSVTKASGISGTVTLNSDFGAPEDINNPRIVITVTNTEADPVLTKSYTLVYDSPISSRISGVIFNGKTYPVSEDGKSIDLRAIGLMPAVADIKPIYILPDGNQTAKVTVNTENGTGEITVTNSEGKDHDGLSSHTYNLIFDSVDLSRPKTITIMNAANNKALTLTPAFDSKKFAYTVNGYRHDDNIDERVRFEWFEGKELTTEITKEGDEYDSPTPKLLVKVSNPNGGTDYDGEKSHTYTFTFNQRTHDNRSVSLASLSVGGVAVPGFDSDVFEYYLDRPVIESDNEIGYSLLEYDGHTTDGTKVAVNIDTNAATVTIFVSNEISNSEGEDEREYILHFLPYYSRLAAIKTADEKVDLLDETGETIRVTVPGQMPKSQADIEATFEFPDKTAGAIQHEVSLDPETATATVKVSNSKPDVDGITSRTYTLKYDAPFFSRLESLVIGGAAVPGFNRNVFTYTIDAQMPANPTITPTVIKGSNAEGKAEIKDKSADAEKALVTVVVTNTQPDIDGESSHTYTVQYALPYFSRLESLTIGGQELTGLPQDGKTPIAFAGQLPATDEEAQALFSYKFKKSSGNPVATVVFDHINATARVTVSNSGQKDTDGKTSHLYIIQFNPPFLSFAASITVDGEEIPDFTPAQLDYTLAGQLPAADKIGVQVYNGNGTCDYKVATDIESATATVTVTNGGDADGNYSSSTVYTLHFDLPYFSRLASLKVRGEDVAEFDKDKFEYTLSGVLPAQNEIVGTPMKASGRASVSVSRNVAEGIATVTVTNSGGVDLDGQKTHTYTLRFDKPINSRLSAISINGTPLADFDKDIFTYRLTSVEMPAEGAVTAESSNPDAKITIAYDSAKFAVTITVTADGADEDGKNVHTYTLNFKKGETPAPSTGKTVEYTGTLNIFMMGDDITGGGQEAKIEIKEGNDGTCTFSLPNFSLDLGDGPAPLGDIVVENVTMTPDGNGGYTYSGEVSGLELAEGSIVADVTLTGSTDALGNAKMKILVLWEGIEINVEFNGVKTAETGNNNPAPSEEWTDFDGTLSIEMAGSYIAENQKATVYITDAVNGKCIFKLPDFSIDLDGTQLTLGDIIVNDVNVENENGTTNYSGYVPDMEFIDGEIIADINLTGTVDASGNAKMTIQVLWKASDEESIPINVEFNGKRNEIQWMTIAGKLTVAIEGYDITEGGEDAVIKIAQTGENGLYTFLLPDFSIALDAASEPAKLGDIKVDDITLTPGEGFDRYTGKVDRMILAGGEIVAGVKVDGTVTTANEVRINVDVTWYMDDNRRVPILVKFSNAEETPVKAERAIYSGTLTTETENSVKDHNVRIYLTPSYDNRSDVVIEGIDLTGSRAAAIGNSVEVPSVSVTAMSNGFKAYDGAATEVKVQPGMTLDISLHGYADLSDKFNLLMDIEWIEEGLRISGTFNGNIEVTAISPVYSHEENDGKAEYFNLSGVKVNGDNLTPGIYIRRTGEKSEKIIIR
ncbi:MAG: hypothetical protein HDS59_00880 [Barnesiella sp.]|nr:hypothetical protein [Barnesiella sp.]